MATLSGAQNRIPVYAGLGEPQREPGHGCGLTGSYVAWLGAYTRSANKLGVCAATGSSYQNISLGPGASSTGLSRLAMKSPVIILS